MELYWPFDEATAVQNQINVINESYHFEFDKVTDSEIVYCFLEHLKVNYRCICMICMHVRAHAHMHTYICTPTPTCNAHTHAHTLKCMLNTNFITILNINFVRKGTRGIWVVGGGLKYFILTIKVVATELIMDFKNYL